MSDFRDLSLTSFMRSQAPLLTEEEHLGMVTTASRRPVKQLPHELQKLVRLAWFEGREPLGFPPSLLGPDCLQALEMRR